MTTPVEPDEALLQALLPHVDAAARYTPARFRSRRILSVVAMFALYGLGFVALGGATMADRPKAYGALAVAGWLAIAAAATVLAFRRPDFGPGLWSGRAALALPLVSFAWLLGLNFAFPQTFQVCTGRPGLVCLDLTLAIGGATVLVMLLFARQSFVVRPFTFGAVTGASAGAWTATLITLSCECTNPSHVALGHVLPVALLTGVGSLLARRWLSR